jgi:hypothetical protein
MVSFPSHPSPILWMTQWHNHVLSPYHIPFPHIAKIMGPKFIIGVFSISAQPATSQLNLKLHFYRENLGKKIKKTQIWCSNCQAPNPQKNPLRPLEFPWPLGRKPWSSRIQAWTSENSQRTNRYKILDWFSCFPVFDGSLIGILWKLHLSDFAW